MRRWRVILLLTGVAAVIAVVAGGWQQREPEYLGKPIGYWIDRKLHDEPPELGNAAFAEMDGRAVEWLVHQLSWKPSKIRAMANRLGSRFKLFSRDEPDRRVVASDALRRLDDKAKSAISALENLELNAAQPGASHARLAATAALIVIRREPVERAVRRMIEVTSPDAPTDLVWTLARLYMIRQGVPCLIDALNSTNAALVRANAAAALATAAGMGVEVKAASPHVAAMLFDTNTLVAARASNVFAWIYPEAAKHYGIRKQEP